MSSGRQRSRPSYTIKKSEDDLARIQNLHGPGGARVTNARTKLHVQKKTYTLLHKLLISARKFYLPFFKYCKEVHATAVRDRRTASERERMQGQLDKVDLQQITFSLSLRLKLGLKGPRIFSEARHTRLQKIFRYNT